MFAMVLERDPLSLADVPRGVIEYVQIVGTLAVIGIVLWALFRAVSPVRGARPTPARPWVPALFPWLAVGAVLGYIAFGASFLVERGAETDAGGAPLADSAAAQAEAGVTLSEWFLTFGAGCAFLAVALPFLANLLDIRWRRVWGIARLSFKEAVRRKVLYVFTALILVLLFLNWFVPAKPESQLRSYVSVVFWTMTPLLILSAALIAAFSIPTDIRQQTIHTIVTKPVERFEIIAGRFLGFSALMTLVLLAMTTVSLFYVLRGVTPEAAAESLKARVPVYGDLYFQVAENENTDRERITTSDWTKDAKNVGREWDYRKHISGVSPGRQAPRDYAVWMFPDAPDSLAERDAVRCEFTFDIYRTHKGKENEGILCSFFFQTCFFDRTARAEYENQRDELRRKGELTLEAESKLSAEYGYFEVRGKDIADYHTLALEVPGGLFRNIESDPDRRREQLAATNPPPELTVRVRCDSEGQFVGMAKYDLYLRQDRAESGTEAGLAFALNFYKGSLGLWMLMCLVVGLCVCVSTELSGPITFLCVMLVLGAGLSRDFIQDLARQKAVGGGSVESFLRLVGRKTPAAPLDETTVADVAAKVDAVTRVVWQGLLRIIPDVDRFGFSDRVANGFNIALVNQDLLPTFLLLAGYLFPWALLGFYLLRWREIAGAY